MNIVLEEMPDVASSCIDEVSFPEKDVVDGHVPLSFSSPSGDVSQYETSEDFGEPVAKRPRIDRVLSQRETMIVRQLVISIGKAVCNRLDAIDEKLEAICINSKYLEDKLEQLVHGSTRNRNPSNDSQKSLLDLNSDSLSGDATKQDLKDDGITSEGHFQQFNFITLNREEDYVDGVWLGDVSKPEMRVRVAISPQDLLHINSYCQTPMKMALTLLDYLFDRDTLASSNLSGHSRHGKKQLDPLLIYGIRCHVVHRFGITEDDWKHIKQNMDSKCRTAFRRKMLGMPLTVKAFRGKVPTVVTSSSETVNAEFVASDESFQNAESDIIMSEDVNLSQLMMVNSNGSQKIQLIRATPEQLSQLNIKIIKDGQILDLANSDAGIELLSQDANDEVVCLVKSEIHEEDEEEEH